MEESRRGTVETGAMPQQLCQMARAAGAKTVALGGVGEVLELRFGGRLGERARPRAGWQAVEAMAR